MVDKRSETALPDDAPLMKRLLERAWEFDFFQAIWLLERSVGGGQSVGGRGPISAESLRFRPHVSMAFPPTDLRRIFKHDKQNGAPGYLLEATFLGLYGVSTPLPLHYAIDVLRSVEPYNPLAVEAAGENRPGAAGPERVDTGSAPVRDFLDIFHHRFLSLFYRAWTKYRYNVTFGMPDRDAVTDFLLWLIGLSPECQEETLGVNPIGMIRYAGALTQRPRSAVMLEGILGDYWRDLPVSVDQFKGRWVPLSPSDTNVIGSTNCCLGMDLTVGAQVFDLSGAFNVSLGPVDWETYVTLLPDGESHNKTRSLVRLYCMDPLSFTLEIKLRAGDVPETRLGSDDGAGRLGFTSWVRTEDLPETSVVFDESSAALAGRVA